MAHHRRSPQHRAFPPSIGSPLSSRRKYLLRRAPSRTSSHASVADSISSPNPNRPVLVPLHNLRRLPSRQLFVESEVEKDIPMRESSHPVQIGAKRKRVVSSNENAHTHSRPTHRGSYKRLRSNTLASRRYASTSEESESDASEMEIDLPSTRWSGNDESELEEEDEGDQESENDEQELDSTDDNLLHSAPFAQLNRLRKKDLVRLYNFANLPDDPELLTKSEIISVIIDARDEDFASLPPSSPPGKTDGTYSDYSSDDGNVAGDEETDACVDKATAAFALRRRVTMHDIGKTPMRPAKGRSLSLGDVLGSHVNGINHSLKRKASLRINTEATSRQRTSNRSSPSTSAASAVGQPLAGHHLRSRKASVPTPVDVVTPTSTTTRGKGKGKAKQVEFSNDVVELDAAPRILSKKDKERERERAAILEEESDLTELEELEIFTSKPLVSPRRLRSKDKEQSQAQYKGKENEDVNATPIPKQRSKKRITETAAPESENSRTTRMALRVIPMRQAKGKIKSLRESDLDEPSVEEVEEVEQEDELEEDEEEAVGDEDAEVEDDEEVDEVDELASSASTTPPPPSETRRKTPLRQRLRRRKAPTPELDGDEENEGDDEQEVDEEEEEEMVDEEQGDEEEEEGQEVEESEEPENEVEPEGGPTSAIEPRRLRNGKIVGEEEIQMEEDDNDTAEDEAADEEAEEIEEIEVDTEEEAEADEPMDDDVDLTAATAKTLVRLRRDDLVRLCETRNLETNGTKPQLAETLLQWRDRHGNGFSSPSSTGTVRPPSTTKRRRKKQSSGATIPVLRSGQTIADEPQTLVPSKDNDQELELDLESLGLEDREIPPEKIQKLEKIGSGGFKDVFIGKFKGRRIAISEFRGQLSAMDIKELKLLGGFDHPNIVRFLGVSIPENTKETPVMIISELCSNGDLFDYIRNVNAPSLHKVLIMMLDIALGLEYLHMRKPSIIHRDCKSSNILITAKGTAKIADFGLAKVKQSTRSMVRSLVGTVNWQAPELWTAHPKYNHKVDVFSCAMVYWEMLQWHVPNKKFPWEGMNEHAIYEIVGAKKQRPSITGLRKQWCPEIVDLIEHMWAQDPQDRPTMSEVVETLQELVKQY